MAEGFEVRIERLAAGGEGVGRLPDGRVVFVAFAAPGDLARVAVEEEHRRFARGRLVELVEPGPGRTEPACPAFGVCGGCTWQHLDYATQLAARREIALDALRRIGGIEPPGDVRLHPSPAPYGYRSRTRLLVRGGRVGYRRRRSHELCAVERCPVLAPELEARLAELARRPPRDGEIEIGGAAQRVAQDELPIESGVFAQSNALLAGALAEAVAAAAGGGGLALELFAGAGTLTLSLARRFARVEAVEGSARAAEQLRANLAAAGLANVSIVNAPVELALAQRAESRSVPECVVLDPPRTGLSAPALASLARLGARRLVYLSCDPATFARDLSALRRATPCSLARVEIFDLFPQTAHVEVLGLVLAAEA
jgi:23S rRNA (uracil1939-C5)-methyltransferase